MLDATLAVPAAAPMLPAAASMIPAAGADPRLAPRATALATRLRAACRGWEAADFDALVQQIARTQQRWADRGYGA